MSFVVEGPGDAAQRLPSPAHQGDIPGDTSLCLDYLLTSRLCPCATRREYQALRRTEFESSCYRCGKDALAAARNHTGFLLGDRGEDVDGQVDERDTSFHQPQNKKYASGEAVEFDDEQASAFLPSALERLLEL